MIFNRVELNKRTIELNKRYDYGEAFYLASQLISDGSEEDILRNLSLLYQSKLYETIVEQDLGLVSPEDIVILYREEIKYSNKEVR